MLAGTSFEERLKGQIITIIIDSLVGTNLLSLHLYNAKKKTTKILICLRTSKSETKRTNVTKKKREREKIDSNTVVYSTNCKILIWHQRRTMIRKLVALLQEMLSPVQQFLHKIRFKFTHGMPVSAG